MTQSIRPSIRENLAYEDPNYPSVIVHIGAGECSELESYLAMQPERIVLVEADPEKAKKLSRRAASLPEVEVTSVAVGMPPGNRSLKVFNLAGWSSLRSPSGLRDLYPGLRQLREVEVEVISPGEMMERIALHPQGRNRLVIDTPGEEAGILDGLHESGHLRCFDSIVLHCGRDNLYEGGAVAETLLLFLYEQGYDVVSSHEDDPDLISRTLHLNPLRMENIRLKGEAEAIQGAGREHVRMMDELKESLRKLAQDNDRLGQQLNVKSAQLEAACRDLDEYALQISARDEQVAQLQGRLSRVTEIAEEQAARLLSQETAIEELKTASAGNEKIVGMLGKADHNFNDLLNIVRNYESRLGSIEQGIGKEIARVIANSTRQIESRIGIESYLSRGYAVPPLGGWAVSADIALFLIRMIESGNYDLIVEFGSGVSTLLMASILRRQISKTPDVTNQDMMRLPADSRDALFKDLIPRIVSFEHQREYFSETTERLANAGVSELVELNYSPLRDYAAVGGEHYLYYACEERIAELAGILRGRKARILAFVDGPPAATGKCARYPALPILLQHFVGNGIDMLLDDYKREDEKRIVALWEKMLDERKLSYEKKVLDFEKGGCILSIG